MFENAAAGRRASKFTLGYHTSPVPAEHELLKEARD